jgi:hypothetical protein
VFLGTHPKVCIDLLLSMFVAVMRLPWGKAVSAAQQSLWQLKTSGANQLITALHVARQEPMQGVLA